MNTRWITDPATGELYFAIGPFANKDDAIPVQRVVQSIVLDPGRGKLPNNNRTRKDGTLTNIGRALMWVEAAGPNGATVKWVAERMGMDTLYCGQVLRKAKAAGLVTGESAPPDGVVGRAPHVYRIV